MKKIKLLSIGLMLLAFASCSKKDDQAVQSSDQRRLEIKEKVALHSKGLQFFYNQMKAEAILKTKGYSAPGDPTVPPILVGANFVQSKVLEYLTLEALPTEGLALISSELTVGNPTILSADVYGFRFSETFYQLALNIIDASGESTEEVTAEINAILSSPAFLALPQIEKDMLMIGGETYIDSFEYWSTELDNWEAVGDPDAARIKTKGFWSSVRDCAKADGKGAVAGAIGGAIGGAIVGAWFGGVGAGPGAAAGAVGTGVATGITNSILQAWNATRPITMSIGRDFDGLITLSDSNLEIPEMWTKVCLEEDVPLPQSITYENGEFVVTP